MKLRFEDFGAIVATDDPPALAWVDQRLAATLAGQRSPRWEAPRGGLSAPTEVHLMTTNRCPAGCGGCYTGAEMTARDADTEAIRGTLETIARAGVFHVAMGGGESLLRDDIFELAAYARELGLVPNLTTSGIGLTAGLARRCRVFGQVNVSLDGLGDVYRESRGYDGAGRALSALRALVDAGVPTGANFVLSRVTFPHVEATVEALDEVGANELEVLRFKPTGRGADVYDRRRLSEAQALETLPMLLDVATRWPRVVMKIDCSLVPLLCASDPDPAVLERFGIFGCEAGNALAAVTHELNAIPCSFLPQAPRPVEALGAGWETDPVMLRYRQHHERAPEPCASCRYRALCKGGCRAVAAHVTGDPMAPDPECPRVIAARRA